MTGNTFGKIFKVTTWGESHGSGLGCIIDGVPADIKLDETDIDTNEEYLTLKNDKFSVSEAIKAHFT